LLLVCCQLLDPKLFYGGLGFLRQIIYIAFAFNLLGIDFWITFEEPIPPELLCFIYSYIQFMKMVYKDVLGECPPQLMINRF